MPIIKKKHKLNYSMHPDTYKNTVVRYTIKKILDEGYTKYDLSNVNFLWANFWTWQLINYRFDFRANKVYGKDAFFWKVFEPRRNDIRGRMTQFNENAFRCIEFNDWYIDAMMVENLFMEYSIPFGLWFLDNYTINAKRETIVKATQIFDRYRSLGIDQWCKTQYPYIPIYAITHRKELLVIYPFCTTSRSKIPWIQYSYVPELKKVFSSKCYFQHSDFRNISWNFIKAEPERFLYSIRKIRSELKLPYPIMEKIVMATEKNRYGRWLLSLKSKYLFI